MFNTYIEDKAMIPVLLGYDWMVSHGTWTDCSYETYMALKKMMRHTGNAMPMVKPTGKPDMVVLKQSKSNSISNCKSHLIL